MSSKKKVTKKATNSRKPNKAGKAKPKASKVKPKAAKPKAKKKLTKSIQRAPKGSHAKAAKDGVTMPTQAQKHEADKRHLAKQAELAAEEASKDLRNISKILKAAKEASVKNTNRFPRYSSGFELLDHALTSLGVSGMRTGIYLLVGDPGSGKSSMALQIQEKLMLAGHLGAYLGYEGKDNVWTCQKRLNIQPGLIPVLDQDDGVPATSAKVVELMQQMDRANKTGKPSVLVVDTIKSINAGSGTAGRRQAMNEIAENVTKYNVILILIAHVSRESRGKANKKIQGPAEIEELCDVRIDLINQTVKGEKKDPRGKRFMLDMSNKNRFGLTGDYHGFFLTANGYVFPDKVFDNQDDWLTYDMKMNPDIYAPEPMPEMDESETEDDSEPSVKGNVIVAGVSEDDIQAALTGSESGNVISINRVRKADATESSNTTVKPVKKPKAKGSKAKKKTKPKKDK